MCLTLNKTDGSLGKQRSPKKGIHTPLFTLLAPKYEWRRVEATSTTLAGLFQWQWLLPAAVSPVLSQGKDGKTALFKKLNLLVLGEHCHVPL